MAEEKLHKSGLEVDALVLQVVVDQKENLSQGLEEFQFNPAEVCDDEEEETDSFVVQASIGQRKPQEIKIEQYISQGSVSSSLTSASDEVPVKELPDNIPYFSGIPAVEIIRGIIHLYRDRSKPIKDRSSRVVCILGVPAHLSLTDLLKFLAPIQESIKSMQVVRDSTPNQYMVILKFMDKATAEQFYSTYHMRRYSSFERRVCQLVYASRIEVVRDHKQRKQGPGLTEVPSCPVCLERLDDTVLTILCNHSFHTDCLTQWEDSTCPICRYTQIPEMCTDNMCSTCDSREDLWICLICGHIGCGRYLGGHAHEHFSVTQHTFSLQVGTQRVWDYIGDNYVHRLVQNKADGKLVEVQGGASDLPDDEKIDSLQLEYTYLLTSQLDSQRVYFEDKLERAEKDAAEQIAVLQAKHKTAVEEKEELGVVISNLERERKEKEKKIAQLQAKVSKLQSEISEEKELNKCLSDNQRVWRERVTALEEKLHGTMRQKEEEIQELRDQVKDLMFYMETQQKISEAPEDMKKELQDGHLVVTTPHEASGGGRKGRRKGRYS